MLSEPPVRFTPAPCHGIGTQGLRMPQMELGARPLASLERHLERIGQQSGVVGIVAQIALQRVESLDLGEVSHGVS